MGLADAVVRGGQGPQRGVGVEHLAALAPGAVDHGQAQRGGPYC